MLRFHSLQVAEVRPDADDRLFDGAPIQIAPFGDDRLARGAVVQGSDLRPPLGIETKVHDKQILAVRME